MAENTSAEIRRLLPSLSPSEARKLGKEFDSEGDELKRRARALFAFADALDGGGTAPVAADPEPESNGHTGTRAAPAAPPSNKRPLIRKLIEDRPNPGWSPQEVRRELIAHNLIPAETSAASIRVTLGRMVERGQLAKTTAGLYTIPGVIQEGMLT